MPASKQTKNFFDQVVIEQELALYIFSVYIDKDMKSTVVLKLAYLQTDDLSWSAYEKSTTTRDDIDIPDEVLQQAYTELNSRIIIA